MICPTLHSKVTGMRGKGTGARKPYLKEIADIALCIVVFSRVLGTWISNDTSIICFHLSIF
jgi:hypothetical protein